MDTDTDMDMDIDVDADAWVSSIPLTSTLLKRGNNEVEQVNFKMDFFPALAMVIRYHTFWCSFHICCYCSCYYSQANLQQYVVGV